MANDAATQDPVEPAWPNALLASVGIPATATALDLVRLSGKDAVFMLDSLLTPELVQRLWNTWHPGQHERLNEGNRRVVMTRLLAAGVRLGFSVERFRYVASSLEDSDEPAAFEDAIAGRCTIRLSLSPAQYDAYMKRQNESGKSAWNAALVMMRDSLFYELGIVYPPIAVECDSSLASGHWVVEWNDLSLPPRQGIRDDQMLVNDTPERLRLLLSDAKMEGILDPANGNEHSLTDLTYRRACEVAGLTAWDSMEYLILELSTVLRRAAGSFVHQYLVWYYLKALEQKPNRDNLLPELITRVRNSVSTSLLVQVLRGLVDEGISIRNLRLVLEVMLGSNPGAQADFSRNIVFVHNASGPVRDRHRLDGPLTVQDYVDHIRNQMKREISHKYTRGANTIHVYLVDPRIEERLRQPVPLFADEREALWSAVREAARTLVPGQQPVILTAQANRARLRDELRHEFPALAVISYQELSVDMNIKPLARVASDAWPYSHRKLWEKIYTRRMAGSLDALIEATSAKPAQRSTSRPHAAASLRSEHPALADLIDERRAEIVSTVEAEIRKLGPGEWVQASLGDFADRYVDGYLLVLGADSRDLLLALLADLHKTLAGDGTRCSDALRVVFAISATLRRLLSTTAEQADGVGLSPMKAALELLESATLEVSSMMLETSYQSKLKGLVQ
jgi:hypothetical protein